ncbi:MAG: hypothetical protein N4A49_08945 [Marinifilaceae bacterium]|jgi:hypothetical protein|nr:hypothetical protein [Marinifilaceae bacterium]
MKFTSFILTIFIFSLTGCNNNPYQKANIDDIVNNIDQYKGKLIETSGKVLHVCGVDFKKLKLQSKNKNIIKVTAFNKQEIFSKTLNNKEIKIKGVVTEHKITAAYINQMDSLKTIPCHVDNKACTDKEWIKRKKEAGVADKISASAIKRLRKRMEKTGKDYVSVVSIQAKEYYIIKE